jgi:hypothetical protein
MRKVLAIMEGDLLPDGRIIKVGGLYVDESEKLGIPVVWANDAPARAPIGWAHDFERIRHDNHGDLSFDIIMNDSNFDLDLFDAYLFCTDIVEEPWLMGATNDEVDRFGVDSPENIVLKARIRMVELVPIPGIAFGRPKK